MVRRCGDKMAKYAMIIYNLVFLACGIALLYVGFSDLASVNKIDSIVSSISKLNWVVAIGGLIIVVISFLGCCGALKEHQCMISTFLTLLIVVVIAEIVVCGIAFSQRGKFESFLTDEAQKSLADRNKSNVVRHAWDDVQTSFKCCGAKGPADYNTTLPATCCANSSTGSTCSMGSPDLYKDGCISKMTSFLEDHYLGVGVATLIILFIEVVGVIFGCCVRSAIREKYETV